MTKCTRCSHGKPDDGYKMCAECRATMRDQYRRLRAEKERAEYAELRTRMDRMKTELGCTDCGGRYEDEPWRLHWDHLPGQEKTAEISELIRQRRWEAVLEEIEKCELVCGSCHGRRGHEREQIGRPRTGTEIPCEVCGTPVRRTPSQRSAHTYCSKTCAGIARRKLVIHHWEPPKAPRSLKPRTLHRRELLGL